MTRPTDEEIEAAIERDRRALADSLNSLRGRVEPALRLAPLAREAKSALEGVPLPVILAGAGTMVLVWRKLRPLWPGKDGDKDAAAPAQSRAAAPPAGKSANRVEDRGATADAVPSDSGLMRDRLIEAALRFALDEVQRAGTAPNGRPTDRTRNGRG